MTQKQLTLMSGISKLVRQHFLYQKEGGKDPVRVKLRNDLHRVEEVSPADHEGMILQRLANDQIGLLHPQYKPYEPVGGWPVLNLDELVLNTMASQLDPKVWPALRSYFDKNEIRRVHEKRIDKEMLNDFTAVHQFSTSGFQKIKTHLAESEARMYNVKAGFDFEQHFLRTLEERRKREAPTKDTVKQFNADPDFILAMERVRRDIILFLNMVKDLLEKMLQVKVRHLKSHTPIKLAHLGTDKDRVVSTRSPGRLQQYPGGPPVQHSFRDQIVAERPQHWPVKLTGLGTSRLAMLRPSKNNRRSSHHIGTTPDRAPSLGGKTRKYGSLTDRTSERHSMGSDMGKEGLAVTSSLRQGGVITQQMVNKFRKLWPPVWMSLAAMEQGCYIVDPACPSREYNQSMTGHSNPRRHRSFTDILDTRREWAHMRKQVSKTLDELLLREDQEKMDFFRTEYATLSHLPLCKPYPTHRRQVEDLLKSVRRQRQKTVIYDCELSEWYKYLVERVQEEVGKQDDEINSLLESIKFFFQMSATYPKLGKAKLALITMSMPAYVVCQVHVQRAITFVLTHVLRAPAPMFAGWLAVRGLPHVLLKSHII